VLEEPESLLTGPGVSADLSLELPKEVIARVMTDVWRSARVGQQKILEYHPEVRNSECLLH
jgi:hypothetical protein